MVKVSFWSNFTKRFLDIVVSLFALGVLSPFLILIAVLIKRDSPGPAFYRGRRKGMHGKEFGILKFRTMYERPESYSGPRVTAEDDTRVTKIGRWLRDTKINELPQFWNVLKGDMSLVGPRPEDPEIAAEWPESVRQEVLSMRPGITSPASVLYRNEETLLNSAAVMDTYMESILPSKLRLDQLYVRNHTFLLDLDILFWTALVLMPRLDAYAPPETALFSGPISNLFLHHLKWFSVDMLVTLVAVGGTGVFWRSLGPLNVGLLKSLGLALAFSALFSLVNSLLGVNRIAWDRSRLSDALDMLPAAFLSIAIALLANFLWLGQPLLPVGMVLMASAMAFLGFVAVRYRTRLVSGLASRWLAWSGAAAQVRERVIIVGGGETGEFAAWLLTRGRMATAFHIVGFVDDDLNKQGMRIQGARVLGRRESIQELVKAHDVGLILFAIHNVDPQERACLLQLCLGTPARVVTMPDITRAFYHLASLSRPPASSGSPAVELFSERDQAGASPLQVDAWLAELQSLAARGEIESVQARLVQLRQQLQPQVSPLVEAAVDEPEAPQLEA